MLVRPTLSPARLPVQRRRVQDNSSPRIPRNLNRTCSTPIRASSVCKTNPTNVQKALFGTVSASRPLVHQPAREHALPAPGLVPIAENGTDNTVPTQAMTLLAADYYDALVYEKERRNVFAREWMCMGMARELEAPGSFLALDFAGYSLFAIRDREGRLQGFHNVCRHRAGPLVSGGKGRCDVLRCKYHGWVYDTQGRLRRVPGEFGPEPVNKDALSLVPVKIEVWNGLVFCNLDPNARPFAEEFGDVGSLLAPYNLDRMHVGAEATEPIACNWKTYVDNYMEGYHINDVHPKLSRECDTKNYRVFVGQRGRFCLHKVSAKEGSGIAGEWIWLFPAVALNVYINGASIERMVPTGPRTMELQYTFMFREGLTKEEIEAARAGSRLLTIEDKKICEAVQRNLESGVYQAGPLSPRHENGVYAFQKWLREARDRVI